MAQSIVGLENVQPYTFSECSRSDYNSALRTGHGICLLNKPNEVSTIFIFFKIFFIGKLDKCKSIIVCYIDIKQL